MNDEHPSTVFSAVQGQPKQVWITAFAAVIAFMGIGLVDPIMKSIAKGLDATPSQVTLLFSSYLGVQVLAMLVTSACSARFGAKRTLLVGLVLIVVATLACTFAGSIEQLIGLRAVWGLGNAFFIATALSVIVGAAAGGQAGAILLYEAALGLGLSVGPLLGALLGSISWRGPFLGTSVLMAGALVLSIRYLRSDAQENRPRVRLADPLRALRHRGLLRISLGSALYTAAFFTVLAWSPFVLNWGPVAVGLVFFGWGLAVAVAGVVLAPKLSARLGESAATAVSVFGYAVLMFVLIIPNKPVVVVAIVTSGLVSGLLNTLFTGSAMSISNAPRPVASAGYNFCRWFGGAIAATLVGHIADWSGFNQSPFLVAGILCLVSTGLLTPRIRTRGHRQTSAAQARVGADR